MNQKRKELRERWVVEGKCSGCGSVLPENFEYMKCDRCRTANKRWSEKRRARAKAKGTCADCNRPLDREGVYCSECLAKHNSYGRDSRKFYKSIGICPICKKAAIMGDENACPECAAKKYESDIKRYRNQTTEQREKTKKAKIEIRAERAEKGLCTVCGKPVEEPEKYKRCKSCREYANKYLRLRRENAIKEPPVQDIRRMNGLCIYCDRPVAEGKKLCEYHCELSRKTFDDYWAKQAERGIPRSLFATERVEYRKGNWYWKGIRV